MQTGIEISEIQTLKKMKNPVLVKSDPRFLFLTFECPHCGKVNVLNKKHSNKEVICSNSGCRRVIVLGAKEEDKKDQDAA
jgi:transcription elongation factor Elf1